MDSTTRLDRVLIWIKNNKFLSTILLVCIGIMALSQLVTSVESLIGAGKEIVSSEEKSGTPTVATDESPPVLKFGGKGIGPGLFTDARSIAVDRLGQIYVAEYLGNGRVQRFDAQGRFLSQWVAEPRTKDEALDGIAVDSHGVAYVTHGRTIYRYAADTGLALGKISYGKDGEFEAMDAKVAADDSLVSIWTTGTETEDLVVFDGDGKVRKAIHNPYSSHNDGKTGWNMHLAVDGAGNIFAVEHYGATVFKFSSSGDYVDRFGGDGIEDGQFHRILSIAVNGKGDVYVGDGKAIQAFDGSGRFLKNVEPRGWPMGIAFNTDGDLFTVYDDEVLKFKLR